MRLLFLLLAALIAVMIQSSSAVNPDFRVTLGVAGIQELMNSFLYKVNSIFANGYIIPVNPLNFDSDKFSLDLNNIAIYGVQIPTFKLQASNPNGLSLTAQFTVYIDTNIDWQSHGPLQLKDKLHVTADTHGALISFSVNAIVNQWGQPYFALSTLNTDIGDLELHFNGSADAFIYDWVKDLFKKDIKNAVNKALHDAIFSGIVTVIDDITNNYKLTRKITTLDGKWSSTINTALTDIEVSGNNFLSFASAMQLTDVATNQPCPYPFNGFIPSYDGAYPNAQLQLYLGDTALTCLFWSAYLHNDIRHVFDSNTTNWLLIIPAVDLLYPNQHMKNTLVAVSMPMFTFGPKGIVANFHAEFELDVVGQPKSLCTLGLNITVGVKIGIKANETINGLTINVQLTELDFDLTIINSNIGPIEQSINFIQQLSNALLPAIEAILNKVLANGLPIPLPSPIMVAEASVTYFNDFIELEAQVMPKIN